MSPFYEKDGISIYCGDARDLLPSLLEEATCFVTDPPYGIDGGRGGQARYRKKTYRADWPDNEDYVRDVCVPIVQTMIDQGKHGAVTPGLRCMWVYPRPASVGVFWQPASIAYEPWGLCTSQPILYYGRDPRAGKGQKPTGRQVTEPPPRIPHPCPKPIAAWTWLVNKVAVPGQVVIDPFLGSGSTLVAAKALGYRAIGIEIDPEYCALAVNQLSQEQLQFESVSEAKLIDQRNVVAEPRSPVTG